MAQWVRLCGAEEVPAEGQVAEVEWNGQQFCLARLRGKLSAVDNLCPHRQGPLGQGWLEDNTVVCPWHSWAFDLGSGLAEYPKGEAVEVFPIRQEDGQVMIEVADSPQK